MKKIRTVQFIIQPVLVEDDGEHLSPLETRPITISAKELDGFSEKFKEQIAMQEAEINRVAETENKDVTEG